MVHRCRTKLTQTKLETYITVLIRCINSDTPIRKHFSTAEIIEILHYGADLFLKGPILIEFNLTNDGLIVVGNLCGSIHSLLRVFDGFGLPPVRRYLFLGGYVGRGKHQIEIIILLILMKLRWPEDVILLRSNHETMEAIDTNDMPSTSHQQHFAEVCQSQFPSEPNMYFMFNQMFDVMPIAAALSKRYLCCSGGVSQWMTCLDNIRNIPRPIYANKIKFLEACLVADILHAQPNNAIEKAFEPSRSGVSYMFSKKGLQSVLNALKLKTLIRIGEENFSHKSDIYRVGVIRNFNDDTCYTVITSPDPHVSSCSTIHLVCSYKCHAVEEVNLPEDHMDTIVITCRRIMSKLETSFETNFTQRSRSELCNWCMEIPRSHSDLRARFYTHRNMDIWVKKFAYDWARADEIFLLNDNLHQSNPMNPSHEERRIRRSAELFPSFYDLRFLKGGHPTRGGTFRVYINDEDDEHQQFMKTIYPDSHNLFVPEPFSTQDPSLLDVDMTESDELVPEEERITYIQRIQAFWHHLFRCFRNCRVVNKQLIYKAALNLVLPHFELTTVIPFGAVDWCGIGCDGILEMKRGVDETSACAGEESGDRGSEGKRMRQNNLTDRLYFNKVVGLAEQYNANAFSLAELLELISPVASIHFNFMVDLRWLLTQYPGRLRQGPITLIVGERMGTDFTLTKTAVKHCGATNVSVGRARLMIPFGTHHSKISIFESSNGRVHIIIATANLLESDWNFKTQAFYHCSGSELTASDNCNRNGSNFQTDLVKYLNEYKTSQDWGLIEHWRDRVANIDLSHVNARVIYSVPGTHKGVQLTKYGHPRLRVVLKELFRNVKIDDFTYHAQFSSFGSLGAAPQNWLTGQFLNSLSGGAETDGEHLRIIYPCVEDVRTSNEGYEAGGSLPYSNSVATKQPYLLNFMHKWRSDRLGRSHAMPHIKTYAAFAKNSLKPSWLLVTSANLSKAAWGDYQLKKTQLTIRSYEFGLLFTDPESLDMLPYDLPLTKYDDDDRVWIVDKTYRNPDVLHKTWP
ncbi:unnamed protein product [Cercopithifilaria johnstoni]|uniref:Serine/threonine specific protein phosphatases domain-containing protein n=1 Tax=Cercopithifilaria johnstoni TaxID=2874296 RepID=A0A8J2LYS8_9BILA|nr:unnamed protein product [Cercopithifilaria johnstoni]